MSKSNDQQILDAFDQAFEEAFARITVERSAAGVIIRDHVDGPVRATGDTPREALRQWAERGAPVGIAKAEGPANA